MEDGRTPVRFSVFDGRDRRLRRADATAFRVEALFTQLPRAGPAPLCPAAVRPWAGLHKPFRLARDVAWQIRDVLLKRQFPRLLPRQGCLASVLRPAESVFICVHLWFSWGQE